MPGTGGYPDRESFAIDLECRGSMPDADTGPDDERLLGELRALLERADPMPSWLNQAARQVYTLRRVDAELAELARDSLLNDPALVVRGGEPAVLTFDASDLTVEVELTVAGRDRRLTGQLVPPQPARIEVRQTDGDVTRVVDADARGRFAIGGLRRGPLSLACHRHGRPSVATDWVRVD
jgi:hypothetical protein